jgi:hypothetical protein
VTIGPPLYRWSPPHRATYADLVCELGERFTLRGRKVVMDANQRAVLEDIYAEDSPGIPTCFSVAMVGPRQTIGKTTTLGLAAIADLVLFDVDLHIWTAHLAKAATSAFRLMRAMIASDPDTRAMFKWPPLSGKGQEVLETVDGRRIPFYARTTGGGRSETAEKLTVDESLFATANDVGATLPTMAVMPTAQVRYASSGGLAMSEFLRGLRDIGRAGGDARRAWHEFGAPERECVRMSCDHLDLSDPGCVLNDRGLWLQANPTDRISLERLEDFRKELPPREFAREFLTWWEAPADSDHPIDAEAWKSAGIDPLSPSAAVVLDPLALSVECSEDLGMSTVGVAGRRPDGMAQVELAKRAAGTGWPVEYVVGRVKARKPVAVVIDPSGPAGFLAERLRRAGVEVTEATGRQVAQACVDVVATVNEGKVTDPDTGEVRESGLVHTRDTVLTTAALNAESKSSGAFERTNEKADVSALYAVALALHGLNTAKGPSVYEERGLVLL